jgi:hypothetical protein
VRNLITFNDFTSASLCSIQAHLAQSAKMQQTMKANTAFTGVKVQAKVHFISLLMPFSVLP